MNRSDAVFHQAATVIVTTLDAETDPLARFELAGAFMFAAADILKHFVGHEMTLNGLQTIIAAIEAQQEGMQ